MQHRFSTRRVRPIGHHLPVLHAVTDLYGQRIMRTARTALIVPGERSGHLPHCPTSPSACRASAAGHRRHDRPPCPYGHTVPAGRGRC